MDVRRSTGRSGSQGGDVGRPSKQPAFGNVVVVAVVVGVMRMVLPAAATATAAADGATDGATDSVAANNTTAFAGDADAVSTASRCTFARRNAAAGQLPQLRRFASGPATAGRVVPCRFRRRAVDRSGPRCGAHQRLARGTRPPPPCVVAGRPSGRPVAVMRRSGA